MIAARDAEIDRYVDIYAQHGTAYRTTLSRRTLYDALLGERPDLAPGGLLDVGAGHGTLMAVARERFYAPLLGTEVVPALCNASVVRAPAWSLPFPDRSFGTVTCFDVLEHLLAEDVPAALAEIARVARDRVVLEVSCRPSRWTDAKGQLHMTIWTPDQWLAAVEVACGPRFEVRHRTDRPLEQAAAVFEGRAVL